MSQGQCCLFFSVSFCIFLSCSLSLHFPQGFSIAKQQLSLSGKTENTHVGQYPPATARALGTASTVGPGSGQNGEDSAPGMAMAAAAAAALGLR